MYKKKISAINCLCALLIFVVCFGAAASVSASDYDFGFDFSFDYGNVEVTDTQYKDSNHAVTMTCTGSDNLSPYNYTATVYSKNGTNTRGISIGAGKTGIFYDASSMKESGVYIKAALNGDDVDTFWGTWKPDDPRY